MKRNDFLMQKAICEGKTKAVFTTFFPGIVDIYIKNDVTAKDGGVKDMFEEKGIISNEITSNIFLFLHRNGIKSHFIDRVSKESFYAQKCDMIPIEVVVRRVASGSYLKRNPEAEKDTDFKEPVVEFFLKDDSRHDPYININEGGKWCLHNAKSLLSVDSCIGGIKSLLTKDETSEVIRQANNIFLLLEWFWKKRGFKLFNFKLEFGRISRCKEKIILADVITPDEWILVKDGIHYDKEPFRNGEPASALKEPYQVIANELSLLTICK